MLLNESSDNLRRNTAIYTAIYTANIFCHLLLQGFQDSFQHKIDEGPGVCLFRALADGFVVSLLIVVDHSFHGQMKKEWIPLSEDKRLPEPSRPAVSIGKRVNEFEFVVEDAASDQQVIGGVPQPVKEARDELWHLSWGWRYMDDLVSGKDSHAPGAEAPRAIPQRGHHHSVRLQEILH